LFVDDREENCAAARNSGIQAIRYQNEDQFRQYLNRLGVPVGIRREASV
jgi:FMN phosphatase YigB (HAD superfamily)